MEKKEKKKQSKKGKQSLNFKSLSIAGGIFHFPVYVFLDKTFYNETLFWWSLVFCGLIAGVIIIKKMKLQDPKSYQKLEGTKLKAYMFATCFLMLIGATMIFGNVINGTLLGLNYLGKGKEVTRSEYTIQRITHNKSRGRTRRRIKVFGRNNPKVYFEKENEMISVNLSERYNSSVDYDAFQTVEFRLQKGLLGFVIINDYTLKK